MILFPALILSVLLQFAAFFITVSLIKRTRFNISWIAISAGFLVMALRRLGDALSLFIGGSETMTDYGKWALWTGVAVSVLMFVASFYIRQIFNLHDRIDRLRSDNEAKVLSAVIRAEELQRKSFARELHDGLGPILSSIKMAVSVMKSAPGEEPDMVLISKTEAAVDSAIAAVREISNDLSPHILERFGLEKAITTFISHLGPQPEVVLHSSLGTLRLEPTHEIALYRIVCELVANTIKHASASEVHIELACPEGNVLLAYSDNGRGFAVAQGQQKGMGLSNIASRVHSLGGTMEMNTRPNRGFFIKIILPYEQ